MPAIHNKEKVFEALKSSLQTTEQIARQVGMTKQTVVKHLEQLREEGKVQKRNYYRDDSGKQWENMWWLVGGGVGVDWRKVCE